MAKKDSIAESDFDPAPSPRGPEEPLSDASRCAPDTPALPATEGVVDRWFNDCIRGSAIARHTPSYNHIHGALDELKRRLNDHLTREN